MCHRNEVLSEIFSKQYLLTLAVDYLTLLVHYIVVLQHVFSYGKVLAFHFLLGVFDLLRDHLRFYGLVFFDAESLYDILHPFTAEKSHEVVFSRDAELCLTRVSLSSRTTSELVVYTSGFVTLSTYDVKAAELYYLLLFSLSLFFVFFKKLSVFFTRLEQFFIVALHEAGRKCYRILVVSVCSHFLLRFEFRISAEYDIGTSSGHVRRDRYRAETSCLCDDLRFFFMLLRVQDIEILYASLLEGICDKLRLFYGNRTYEDRLAFFVCLFDSVHDRFVLALFRRINGILQVISDNRLVRRDNDYVHVVDISEFAFLGLRRTGHPRELLIHSEVILQRYRCKCLRFRTHQHVFLGFDRLVESVAVSSSEHQTSRELIDDDDLAVLYDIVYITLHHVSGLQSLQHVMVYFHVLRVREVLHAEILFTLLDTFVGERDLLVFFFYRKVVLYLQRPDESVRTLVHVCRLVTFSRNYQRCSRFVDQDGVDFVDDGIVELTLHHRFFVNDHVITQIVETVFVVRSICYICQVCRTPFLFRDTVYNAAYCQSEECVKLAHPFHVSLCQVVVDCNDVHAFSFQRVQIRRECSNEGLTFTCLHF